VGELVGRGSDCAQMDRLLEAACDGDSGSLVVRGEAGIGKTALLAYAADRADAMTVLRCSGVESESDLVFAGMYGLVRPILGHLGEVADRQSAALTGALGLAPSAGADRFLVSAALLSLLAAAAEARPVLCVVDDAQWLDTASAGALVFTARRLRAERVAMPFGARDGDPRRFEAPGLPELVLTGLDDSSAAAVLARRLPDAAGVRERLLTEAAGNPLALLELPAGLSPAQLGLPPDVLDPAEEAGLIRAPAGMIVFRHPLVRSALQDAATLNQRQRAHAALSAALTGDEHADRRVWHQAMATLTADEEVAAALEASARRSQVRGAHSSAVTAFVRAAELSTDPQRRTSRLAAGAHAAWAAGEPGRARGLIERALPGTSGQARTRLLLLGGVIEARCGDIRAALRLLLESAAAASETSLTLEVLGEAAETAAFAGDFETATELGLHAATLTPGTDRDRFLAAVLTGLSAAMTGDHDRARSALGDVVTLAGRLDDPRTLIWAASAAWAAPELADGLSYANRAVALARESGLVSMLPLALQHQATALLDRDRFDLALAAAVEGYRLALDTGQSWAASWPPWPWSRPSGDAASRRAITPGSCSRWDAAAKPPTSSASPNGGSACCTSPRAARTRPPATCSPPPPPAAPNPIR
jgi:tetratricopeptide (TPR) repeat protein